MFLIWLIALDAVHIRTPHIIIVIEVNELVRVALVGFMNFNFLDRILNMALIQIELILELILEGKPEGPITVVSFDILLNNLLS
jgi:hypothetical protein